MVDDGLPQMFAETAVYQRFTPYPSYFGGRLTTDKYDTSILRNIAPAEKTLGAPTASVYGDGYVTTDGVPVGNVSTGRLGAADCAVNGTAVSLRSNEYSRDPSHWSQTWVSKSCPCWNFEDAKAEVSTNDVTAEMFFCMTNLAVSSYFFLMGRPAWVVMALADGGQSKGISVNGTTVCSSNIADGKWHHLALVADGTTKKGRLYLDYVQWGNEISMGTSSSTYEEYVGIGCYGKDRVVTFTDIDIDEVRITRRKLEVGEFLHETRKDVIVDLDYEGDGVYDLRRKWMSRMLPASYYTGSGSVRTFDAENKPAAFVADGILSAPVTNASAGCIVGGSNRDGSGYQKISGEEIAAITNTGFTIEFNANFPNMAYTNYQETGYLLAHKKRAKSNPAYMMSFNASDGILKFCTDYDSFMPGGKGISASDWMDGKWHHYAIVYDKTASELRAYFDHGLVATKTGLNMPEVMSDFYFGTGLWGYTLGLHSWRYDNFRITKRALKPCEFKAAQSLTGNTLVWAPFDRNGSLISEIGLNPTFSGAAWATSAGQVKDASGAVVRASNRGSFSDASGAGAYSRLSLIERKDQTVEFFIRSTGAVANGTDLVKLVGPNGTPIWAVRTGTDGKMHAYATPQDGSLADLGALADLPSEWKHVAIAFNPVDNDSKTEVTLYFDHEKVAETSFDGTLAVDDISTSALTCGNFAGAVDELRVSKGVLEPAEMLYATKLGMIFLIK